MVLDFAIREKEDSMCTIKEINHIVINGIVTFRKASRGRYSVHSDEVNKLRKELFEVESQPSDDRRNLRKDRKAIEMDVRISFEKYKAKNGKA